MKTTLITGIIALAMFGSVSAQDNPFAKTAWKIEAVNIDGSVILKKTKMIKTATEQAKFHYIQFEDGKAYNTGTSCFSMRGRYEIYDNHQVAFTGLDAAAASDCPEPLSLSGTYVYVIDKDSINLTPVTGEDQQSNEEPYEAAEAVEAVDSGGTKEIGK